MNLEGEFNQNVKQLMELLKKILSQSFPASMHPEWPDILKNKEINLNVCFFNIFPPDGDEFEDWLDQEGESVSEDSSARPADWAENLNSSDLDFLKKNGIRF